jgi:2-aminoadipate transaminase
VLSRSKSEETAVTDQPERDWSQLLARRCRTQPGGGALADILALAGAGDVITLSGGFPAPETFPTQIIGDLTQQLLSDEPGVALQYSPTRGLASVGDAIAGRLQAREGRRPAEQELMVTSGGIDALELLAKSLLDPGDVVLVEAPTYLGAIMGFTSYEADVRAVPMDEDGLDVQALSELLATGLRAKMLYTIPDHQNPSGRTMSPARRTALVDLARRYGLLLVEDVAYRELSFDGERHDSLWSTAPDVVVQVGTFSKTFFPGVRLGWAAGPAELVSRMVECKQNSDQCSGALGQRLLEEYLRRGHLDRQLALSRRLYADRCETMMGALQQVMPPGVSWTRPSGGFFTWLTAPAGIHTTELAPRAQAAGVAFVPGTPFYPDGRGSREMRLSFSRVSHDDIRDGIRVLADLLTRTSKETQ